MSWTINGRFYSQPVTGVQRFARELVAALESQVSAGRYVIELPKGSSNVASLQNIATHTSPLGRGHAWEQAVLPMYRRNGLINLCNTGPAISRKQVVCIHDANVFEMPESYSLSFRSFYRQLLPILGRQACQVVTVSQTSADLLVRHGVTSANKIAVVPNGFEHTQLWDASKSRLARSMAFERPFVVAIASLAKHKNLGLLFRISEELDAMGFDMVLAGKAAGIFAGRSTSQKSPSVKAVGFVSDDDLAFLYQNAHCLLFPSFVEGFGLPLVEAMAFGCPIVCSNTSCLPEIGGEYAIYASPYSEKDWLTAIPQAQRSRALEEAGRERLAHYSWQKSARQMADISATVLK